MKEKIVPILQVTELLKLHQTGNIILIDASNGENAKDDYNKKHLDGALFIDLNTQLADIKDDLSIGGRHPLPSPEKFAKTLSEFGISKKSHVVLYDNSNGANAASRFWWMLKSVGLEKVQVLNGGFAEAENAGFPTNNEIVLPVKSESYNADKWQLPLADIDEVEQVSQKNNYKVIDVRAPERYKGHIETFDLIAGHIPGAVNIPFANNLDNNGLFHSAAKLKTKYQEIFNNTPAENIIVHCGSGVTACHTLLAIAYAELDLPKLYIGSWSEWSRNDKVIATEK